MCPLRGSMDTQTTQASTSGAVFDVPAKHSLATPKHSTASLEATLHAARSLFSSSCEESKQQHIRVALPVAHVCKKDLKTISSRSQMLVQAVSDAPPTSGSLASLAR